jgi:hypothetical protein
MNNCRICLSSDEQSQIPIFDDNGRTEGIATIIAKHLWFQVCLSRHSVFIKVLSINYL